MSGVERERDDDDESESERSRGGSRVVDGRSFRLMRMIDELFGISPSSSSPPPLPLLPFPCLRVSLALSLLLPPLAFYFVLMICPALPSSPTLRPRAVPATPFPRVPFSFRGDREQFVVSTRSVFVPLPLDAPPHARRSGFVSSPGRVVRSPVSCRSFQPRFFDS